MDKKQLLLIGGVLLLAIGAIVGIGLMSDGVSSGNGSAYPKDAVVSGDWVRGQGGKEVLLVEYSDFECPACGSYYPLVEEVIKKFDADIRFVYRHFPLPQHRSALLASYASEAAGLQGKFWEMHAKLFQNQQSWVNGNARESFLTYAKEIGLDMEKFEIDIDSQEVIAKVSSVKASGFTAGVNSTPTFYLNGEKIASPQSLEAFQTLIQQAIDTAGDSTKAEFDSYTKEEVAGHKNSESCWSIVDGKIYDLTDWVAKHPGGPETVLSMCGTDSTATFMEQHGSKEKILDLLATFEIGRLAL